MNGCLHSRAVRMNGRSRTRNLEADAAGQLRGEGLEEAGVTGELEEGLELLPEGVHRVGRDEGKDEHGAGGRGEPLPVKEEAVVESGAPRRLGVGPQCSNCGSGALAGVVKRVAANVGLGG